jgi:hypothetical protein
MDAQRTRRTRDQARKTWYAHYRQIRFARWFGFIEADADLDLLFRRVTPVSGPMPRETVYPGCGAPNAEDVIKGVIARIS